MEQLQRSRAQVEELRGALQAASSKQAEQESLLADFTQVVQQQKSRVQVGGPEGGGGGRKRGITTG